MTEFEKLKQRVGPLPKHLSDLVEKYGKIAAVQVFYRRERLDAMRQGKHSYATETLKRRIVREIVLAVLKSQDRDFSLDELMKAMGSTEHFVDSYDIRAVVWHLADEGLLEFVKDRKVRYKRRNHERQVQVVD